MKRSDKLVSIILSLVMVMVLGMGTAIALGNGGVFRQVNGRVVALFEGGIGVDPTATDDPYLTLLSGSYTNILPIPSLTTVNVEVVPADSNYTATYFNTEQDVANLEYVVFGEDGISSSDVKVSILADEITTGQYKADVTIVLPDDGSSGTVSVQFINKAGGDNAYLNVTVARDSATIEDPQSVVLRLYNPSYDIYYDTGSMIVSHDEFNELKDTSPDATLNAATGMDALFYSYDAANPTGISQDLTNVSTSYSAGFGNYVNSMTISGDVYAASGNNGWMYGAYRQPGAGAPFDLVDVTPYVGTDVYFVASRDVLIWKYGDLGSYNSLFPAQIVYP